MNRINELSTLFAESGLQPRLSPKSVKFHEKQNFTKLLFERNDWRFSSIEIWDLATKPSFFRITYRPAASRWVKTRLQSLPGASLKSCNVSGCSYEGNFAAILAQLRGLLEPTSHGLEQWPANVR